MKNKIIVLIIILAVFGGGYYFWKNYEKADENISKQPSLEREINITANIADETKELAQGKIEEIRGNLKENSDLRSSWLDLASYYKLIGDYDGAREVWEYMVYEDSSDFVPLYNLGNLYGYYLKDYDKAEEYFNKAVEVSPNYIATYAAFYDFYMDYDKPDMAENVIKRGIEANPGDMELSSLLQIHQNN